MAYNKKTMKLIDGMMPPTTTDKASYSTKKTASSQLGKTAKQLDEEEKSFYERTKNLPANIQALAKADKDKAERNTKSSISSAIKKAENDAKKQKYLEHQQAQALKDLANSGSVPAEAAAAAGVALGKIAANNAQQRETQRQQLQSLKNAVETGTVPAAVAAKIVPNITGETVKPIGSSTQEIKDYVNNTNIPDYAKADVIKSMVKSGSNVDRLNPSYIKPSYDSKDLQLFMKLNKMPRDKAERYLNNLSPSELISVLNEQKERKDILEEAYDYFMYTWIPTEDVIGYGGKVQYHKGVMYRGPAYSQTGHSNVEKFDKMHKSGELYNDTYTRQKDSKVMPIYGQDCSGFVSDTWDLPRLGTWALHDEIQGVYNEETKNDIVLYELDSMYDLKPGDAILDAGNHIRLVEEVIGDRVFCIEQTTRGDDGTHRYSYHISELDGYIPISKFDPNE